MGQGRIRYVPVSLLNYLMKYPVSIFCGVVLSAFAISAVSCGGKKETNAVILPEENTMMLTEQDTTATLGLVTSFMDHIVAGEKDAATDMLYTVDIDDPNQEPYKVTQEQLKEMDLLLSNPIKRYEIADYDFESAVRNEVRCRIFITDNVSTNIYFKPVRFLGTWYLCLKDSSEGDRPLGDKSKDIAL